MQKMISLLLTFLFTATLYADYKEVEVANGGKLVGSVTFKGEKKLEGFKITKDQDCCGVEKENHRLVVNDQKQVQNAMIMIEGIAEGKKWPKQERLIDQKDCIYVPYIQFVEVGKKVKIANNDPVLHNVHGYFNGKTVFNLAMPLPGQVIRTELKDEGMYDISCDAGHSWMSAYIYASKHPYIAISGADGSFDISDVPPGEYTVKMWHGGWRVKEAMKDEQGIVTAYKYEEPVVKEVKVKIEAGQTATLNFELE